MNLKMLLLTAAMLAAMICPAHADEFKRIPILDHGRVKPLDTFARNALIQFSGKDTYERRPAIDWMADVFFAPEKTAHQKIFLINNPDVAVALEMEPSHNRRYAFTDIQKKYTKLSQLAQAALKLDEKERSVVDQEVIRLYENVQEYADFIHEFAFLFPHEDFTVSSRVLAAQLNMPEGRTQLSFWEAAHQADTIKAVMAGIERKSIRSADEEETVRLLSNMYRWSLLYKDMRLGLIPQGEGGHAWLSPWDTLTRDFKNDQSRVLLDGWRRMAAAYHAGDKAEFNRAAQTYIGHIAQNLSTNDSKKTRTFGIELIYHAWRPFLWAKVFYIFVLVCFVVSFMTARPWIYRLAWVFAGAGCLLHVGALTARILIMSRPPVSTLYETFIFVSLIMVVLGLLIERINKQWLGLVVTGVGGAVLLFIASKYSAEGDTLKMLIAVLNSNFWLGTHVVTITMGYGATCVAGILGHIWLIQAAARRDPMVLRNTYGIMVGILGLALTLTFLGTNLGGIWADQSWGRFWGWDPKENGALMIVLWTAMLLHMKVAKMIGDFGMAVGTVLGMIVVAWAWFGVNLLSIGLHSYGFTSGIATTLLIYVVCEILFLCAAFLRIKKRT